MTEIDWYEHQDELESGMAFTDFADDIVRLTYRVPGDGTRWYVSELHDGKWFYFDREIEPSDLKDRMQEYDDE